MRPRLWVIYAFIAPVLVVMAVIVLWPLIQTFYISFTDMTRANQGTRFKPPSYTFVGLQNYMDVLTGKNPDFYPALIWTVVWTSVNVFFHYSLGMILALLLNQRFRGRTIYRLILLLPWAVPSYITALSWLWLFNGEYGLINLLIINLRDAPVASGILGALGIQPTPWLSTFPWYYIAPIVVNVWLGVPFMMVALLGGLQSIPPDAYEAAYVDGASRWQTFWNVTMPMLRPVSVTVTLLGIIWTFNLFVVIYLVTGGGPAGRTNILVTLAYNVFREGQFALASTYAVIVFILLVSFAIAYRRLTADREMEVAR